MSASDSRHVVRRADPQFNYRHIFNYRYIVVAMGFTAGFFSKALELTASVGLVAMVNNSAVASKEEETAAEFCLHFINNSLQAGNWSLGTDEKEDDEFLWEPRHHNYIIWSSLACYVLAVFPMGKMTQSAGCKKVLYLSTFFPSVMTFLTPLAAWCGVSVVIFVQSLRGAAQAGTFPALSVLVSNWFPKLERGFFFTIILTSTSWGSVAGKYVTGYFCQSPSLGGWPSAFYAIGGAGIIASLFIGYFLYDNPSIHPKISKREFEYIINNQENVLTQKKPDTPWGRIFSSVSLYALAFAYFGQMWLLAYFINVLPIYFKIVLYYSLEKDGLFSVLPFLLQFMIALTSSWLTVFFYKNNYMSIDQTRKLWNFMSCSSYTVCLLGIYFAGYNRPVSLAFSMLSLSCIGFALAGCWVTSVDMSPTFAGSVNSVAYLLGVAPSFILPLLVQSMTNKMEIIEQWSRITILTIGVVMSSGTLFAIFGSAEIQPWNNKTEKVLEMSSKKPSSRKPSIQYAQEDNFLKNIL